MKRCLLALLTIALFSAQLQSGENDDRFAFFENKIRQRLPETNSELLGSTKRWGSFWFEISYEA